MFFLQKNKSSIYKRLVFTVYNELIEWFCDYTRTSDYKIPIRKDRQEFLV